MGPCICLRNQEATFPILIITGRPFSCHPGRSRFHGCMEGKYGPRIGTGAIWTWSWRICSHLDTVASKPLKASMEGGQTDFETRLSSGRDPCELHSPWSVQSVCDVQSLFTPTRSSRRIDTNATLSLRASSLGHEHVCARQGGWVMRGGRVLVTLVQW